MGVRLNNTDDGGTVNILLEFVTRYEHSKGIKYAYYKIPGKETPTIDSDTYVVSAKRYSIGGLISDAEKVEIEALEQEPDKQIKLTDNELTDKLVRCSDFNIVARPGYVDPDYPWRLTIVITAEDH